MLQADAARALVARSTAAQGLPEVVVDSGALARVAAILHATKGNAGPHHRAGVTNTITITTDPTAQEGGSRDPSY